jgi:hypothetical protein
MTAAIRYIDLKWPAQLTPRLPPWHCKRCGFEARRINGRPDGKLMVLRPRPSSKRAKICPSCLTEVK